MPIGQLTLDGSELAHDEIIELLASSIEQAFTELDLTAEGGVQQLKVTIPSINDDLNTEAVDNQLTIDVPLAIAPYEERIYPMHAQVVLDSNASVPPVEFNYDFKSNDANPESYNFKLSIELPIIPEKSSAQENHEDIALKAELSLIRKMTWHVIENIRQREDFNQENSANLLNEALPIVQEIIQQANSQEKNGDNILKAALPIILETIQQAIDGATRQEYADEEAHDSHFLDIYFVKLATNDWEMHHRHRADNGIVTQSVKFDANGVLEPNCWCFGKDGVLYKEFYEILIQICKSPDIIVKLFFDIFNISTDNQLISVSHTGAIEDGKVKTIIFNQQNNTVLAFYGNSCLTLGKISLENNLINFVPNDLSYLEYDSKMRILPSSLASTEISLEFIKSLPHSIYEAESNLSKKEDIAKSFALLAALYNFPEDNLIKFNQRYQKAWQEVFLALKAPNIEFTPLTANQYTEVKNIHRDCNLAVRWVSNNLPFSVEPLTRALAHNKNIIIKQIIRQYQYCISNITSPILFSQKCPIKTLALEPEDPTELDLAEDLEPKLSKALVL